VNDLFGSEPAPAWFGKIACLGDFASRRLPQDTAQKFDTWLARGVEASRTQLGERWMNVYLTSPLWRFALAPGVLDGRWWFGVLMPSVDNVGRYFPLLVTQACDEAPHDSDSLNQLEHWFASIAQAALGTLQPGGTLEQFEAELAQAPGLPALEPATPWPAAQWPERSRHELAGGVTLAQCLNELAVVESLRRFRGCSLWWSLRPGSGPSSLSTAVGLPAGDSFIHMLEGSW
jgi:type VI secretion system protein ImpM